MQLIAGPWEWRFEGGDSWNPPAGAVGAIDLRSLADHTLPGFGLFALPDGLDVAKDYVLLGDMRDQLDGSAISHIEANTGITGLAPGTVDQVIWQILTELADPTGQSAARPLMPTTKRESELWLGTLIRREAFTLASAHGALVIDMMQRQYRELRADARDGKYADPEFHRRVLDYWGEKYALAAPQDVFIPSDLPKETPLKHATSYTESFNTADSGTLGPDLTWSEVQNAWEVKSNQAYTLGSGAFLDGRCRAQHDVSSVDHYAEITINALGTNAFGGGGANARYSAAADTCYQGWYYVPGVATYLSKIVTGTRTNLGGPNSITVSLPDTVKCEANGSAIKTYWNGASSSSVTDTAITTGTRGGFCSTGEITGGISLDAFTVADLAAAGQVIPVFMNQYRQRAA